MLILGGRLCRCEEPGRTVHTAHRTTDPTDRGSGLALPADLAAGTYYLRADTIARDADGATIDLAYGANRLAYVGASFTVA